MTLEQILAGIEDAEKNLATRQAITSPTIISEHMYRLGQYTSALEKYLGDAEAEYEVKWANIYSSHTAPYPVTDEKGNISSKQAMSATAAKQQADVETAEDKGNIKRLTRYVASSWKNQTGAMARINHISNEMKSGGV